MLLDTLERTLYGLCSHESHKLYEAYVRVTNKLRCLPESSLNAGLQIGSDRVLKREVHGVVAFASMTKEAQASNLLGFLLESDIFDTGYAVIPIGLPAEYNGQSSWEEFAGRVRLATHFMRLNAFPLPPVSFDGFGLLIIGTSFKQSELAKTDRLFDLEEVPIFMDASNRTKAHAIVTGLISSAFQQEKFTAQDAEKLVAGTCATLPADVVCHARDTAKSITQRHASNHSSHGDVCAGIEREEMVCSALHAYASSRLS